MNFVNAKMQSSKHFFKLLLNFAQLHKKITPAKAGAN